MIAVHILVGFALSLLLIPVAKAVAVRFGVVARPSAQRWHSQPTPLLGGTAIALTVLGIAAVDHPTGNIWLLLGCGAAMFIVGVVDDIVSLKPSTKLVAQIAVASMLVYAGYRLHWSSSLTLDMLLTLVWLVGLTNAFNLLDNMDGLCGGVAVIAAGAVLIGMLSTEGATPEARFTASMVGAVGGFLIFNVNPASIFMGDSGSLFIGLNLAALTAGRARYATGQSSVLSVMIVPVLVLLIPIFDTTLVTIMRLLSGRAPSQGGRDHSSHRLVAIGLSERTAVAMLWALAGIGGAIALSVRVTTRDVTGIAALLFLIAMAIFAAYLSQVRVYDSVDSARRADARVTPIAVNFMYKRRVVEVLLDVSLVAIAYYSAYRLRFGGELRYVYLHFFLESLPIVLPVQMVSFFIVGGYRGVWRYFGMMDAVTFAKGVVLGTLASQCVLLYAYRFENYSRAAFIIYATLLFLMVTASRASFRLIAEFARRRHNGLRVVVYGAGNNAMLAVRDLLQSIDSRYKLLGFVDDEISTRAGRVHGYPVLGGYEALISLVNGGAVDCVVVSATLVEVSRLRELEEGCAAHGVTLYRVHFRLERLAAS